MPRAAGRVDDREAEQRLDGLIGVLRDGAGDDRIERGALPRREDARECWEAKSWLASCHATEDDLRRFPQIRETVVRVALHRAFAQPPEAVALRVERPGGVGRAVGVEEPALLDGE